MNAEKTLKAMSNNKRDWCMKDLLCVARNLGIPYSNNGTSHYVFRYQGLIDNVSIPDHHDIHPDYITKFLKFVKLVHIIELPRPKERGFLQHSYIKFYTLAL